MEGAGGLPLPCSWGDVVLGPARCVGAGFPGKVQSYGRVGKRFALVWRGRPGEALPHGLPACSLDGRWTLPREKLQWLLVSTRRRVSYLYPIYTDSYPLIGITIFM